MVIGGGVGLALDYIRWACRPYYKVLSSMKHILGDQGSMVHLVFEFYCAMKFNAFIKRS